MKKTYESNSQVIDGKTDYSDVYGDSRNDAMTDMSTNGDNYSGDNKDIASDYFDTIKN